MARYDPKVEEPRRRAAWEAAGSFLTPAADDPRPKAYVLEMFPYPSGAIHMGHVRNYAMGDVVARHKRATGHAVLHPMGWDAFGMPAENAAMERGVHPKAWTYANIAAMRAELQSLGLSIDWTREFATCDPTYYGRQQAWFLQLLKRGLVDRREASVNWDPVDNTVLANEQVIDGRGWRSGAVVEKKKLTQWFLRITDYADRLIEGLSTLDRWPEKVRLMQENWIGRSRGLRMTFRWAGAPSAGGGDGPLAGSAVRPLRRGPRRVGRAFRGRRRLARASWPSLPTTRWRRRSRRPTPPWPPSAPRPGGAAPARRTSRGPRSWGATRGWPWSTPSPARPCPCGSPTSC